MVMYVLPDAEGVRGAWVRRVDLPQTCVYTRERTSLGASGAPIGDNKAVPSVQAARGLEAAQTIVDEGCRLSRGLLCEGLDRIPGELPLRQAHLDQLAGLGW